MNEFEDQHPDLKTTTERRLLHIVKLAYRKHCMHDDSIGWDELQSRLADEICNATSPDHYVAWIEAEKRR